MNLLLNEKTLCFPILKCFGDLKYTNTDLEFFLENTLVKLIWRILHFISLVFKLILYNLYNFNLSANMY